MTRKKGLLLLVLAGMMHMLTGCWSRIEVNDLAIVTATAVDKAEEGDIRLTLQIAIPMKLGPIGIAGGGGGGTSTVIVSEEGATVLDAVRRIQEKLPRKLFFSHSRVLIIGDRLARDGVAPILDFFSRYRESRLRSFLLFAKGNAADILKIKPKWERVSAEEIREEEKGQIGIRVYLNDFLNMLLAEGEEPIAAQIEIKQSEVKSGSKERIVNPSSNKEMRVAITGTAVFHKDKLIGWLDDKETRGVMWLRNELKTAVVTVSIPEDKGGGRVSAQVIRADTKLVTALKGGQIEIEAQIRAKEDLYENTSRLDLSDPEVIQYVQRELENNIKDRIESALEKVQKQYKSDVFGFGAAVHRAYPRAWKRELKKKWDQQFPQVTLTFKPHVTVVRTGLTSKSITWEEEELHK